MPGTRPHGPLLTLTSRARVVHHRISTPRWTAKPIRIAFLSDVHAVAPWTTPGHLRRILSRTAQENPDVVIHGGDYLAEPRMPGRPAPIRQTVQILSELTAPLGCFAVLGNHDWKDCARARASRGADNSVVEAFADSPIHLLRNSSVALRPAGAWLVGYDSQMPWGRGSGGFHDPAAAFAQVPANAPAILAAHEPDCFGTPDDRAALQLSGHTHAGQFNLFGWRPMVRHVSERPYAHGHFTQGGNHLVVSAGIGFSGLPVRIATPPEITIIDLTGPNR